MQADSFLSRIKPYQPCGIFVPKVDANYLYEVYLQASIILGGANEVAYGIMVDAEEAIMKTSLYKHGVKKNINDALEMYKRMQHEFYVNLNFKRDYFITFLDKYDDNAAKIVDRLKHNFINTFNHYRKEEYGYEKGLMLAAYNALDIANIAHKAYFDNLLPVVWRDRDFRIKCDTFAKTQKVKASWGKAIDCISFKNNFDLLKYSRCKKVVEDLYIFIRDKKNIHIPANAALKEHPDVGEAIKLFIDLK